MWISTLNTQEDKILWNGQTLRLPGVGVKDSRPSRIESLRVFLETEIGADNFLHAYRLMESVTEVIEEITILNFILQNEFCMPISVGHFTEEFCLYLQDDDEQVTKVAGTQFLFL